MATKDGSNYRLSINGFDVNKELSTSEVYKKGKKYIKCKAYCSFDDDYFEKLKLMVGQQVSFKIREVKGYGVDIEDTGFAVIDKQGIVEKIKRCFIYNEAIYFELKIAIL